MRSYQVTVSVNREHTFVVDARSPEDAEATVENWLADGEDGTIESMTIDNVEVVPIDEADGVVVEAA